MGLVEEALDLLVLEEKLVHAPGDVYPAFPEDWRRRLEGPDCASPSGSPKGRCRHGRGGRGRGARRLLPSLVMGIVQSLTGSYFLGFVLMAVVALGCLAVLRALGPTGDFDRTAGHPAYDQRS
jgi:hypothetical protein